MRVIIVAAISVDGFMGTDATQSTMEWRSREDGLWFTRLTREAGIMIMGATTYKTFRMKRAPPGRRLIIYTHHPEEITGDGIETTRDDPVVLLKRLQTEGYTSVAVCGGAQINSLFLASGLATDLYLTIEPVLFGSGVPLFAEASQHTMVLVNCTPLNTQTILTHYSLSA
jgi:dihydrofolate reductase